MYLKFLIFNVLFLFAVGCKPDGRCWHMPIMDDYKTEVKCASNSICSSIGRPGNSSSTHYKCKKKDTCMEEIGTLNGCHNVTLRYKSPVRDVVYEYCCCEGNLCLTGCHIKPNPFLTFFTISLVYYFMKTK